MFEDGYANAAKNHFSTELSSASDAAATPIHAIESGVAKAQEKLGLRDLLQQRNVGSDTFDAANSGHEIIVRHSPTDTDGKEGAVSADLIHQTEVVGQVTQGEHKARRWEDLAEQEKRVWKKRLVDAGQWSMDEGESVLKGVLFSGLANVVGGIVGGG